MKLYDIPEKSKIHVECSDGSKYVTFNHLDGMYSHCTTEKGGLLHLSCGTPLKVEKDGYMIDESN